MLYLYISSSQPKIYNISYYNINHIKLDKLIEICPLTVKKLFTYKEYSNLITSFIPKFIRIRREDENKSGNRVYYNLKFSQN